MKYMETVIIITEIKLTTVNDNIHDLYIHELYGRFAFSHIGRFRLTPAQ